MKYLKVLLLTLLSVSAHAERNANLSAIGSFLLPGSMQWMNDRPEEGKLHFLSFATGVAGSAYFSRRSDYLSDKERYNDDQSVEYNSTGLQAGLFDSLLLNSMFYSSYDAYRDIRYPQEKETLAELALAPFQWQYLTRPTTYGPLLLLAAIATQEDFSYQRQGHVTPAQMAAQSAIVNDMTAVGEEAFFRGYLNHELGYQLGESWAIGLSSVGFGLAHNGEGNQADALSAAFIGGYLAWLHQSNNGRLGENVALHYWINMISDLAAISRGNGSTLLRVHYQF